MSRSIKLRPVGTGWKVFEGPGVKPVFPGSGAKELALSYATERTKFGRCEIRGLDEAGAVTETLCFNETERRSICRRHACHYSRNKKPPRAEA